MSLRAFEHRYADHTLNREQCDIQTTIRALYSTRVTPDSIRKAEASGGIDPVALTGLRELGILEMGLPDSGATLTDLVAAAEAVGAGLGGLPLPELWVAARLLVRSDKPAPEFSADRLATVAFRDMRLEQPIVGGAAAETVVGSMAGDLVAWRLDQPLRAARDTAGSAMAIWSAPANGPEVLCPGTEGTQHFEAAMSEWRILVSASAVGAATTAIQLAVEFAKTRETRGVPIGALQAISHSLADAHVAVVAARNLTRRAAWFEDNEAGRHPEFSKLALVHANRSATLAAHVAVHVHGGQGVSTESDVTLAFTRARQWPLAAGNPESLLIDVGRQLLTAATRGATR